MFKYVFLIVILDVATLAEDAAAPDNGARPLRTVTVSLMAGFASTFQLVVGGTYGAGPEFRNKLTVSLNNAPRSDDSLSVFGWSTTDLPTVVPDWQAGLVYKTCLLQRKSHTLEISRGLQRWVLPNVRTGAKDWLLSGNLLLRDKSKARADLRQRGLLELAEVHVAERFGDLYPNLHTARS
jgi:hypothetical protein